MKSDDRPAGTARASGSSGSSSWRELAVARSLDSARSRAETRVQRFLDAALELMNSDSGKEFTVQEVVERSGQSLRSFYQYFAGKYELQLALFEESIRSTAEHLRERVEAVDDPLERVHRFALEYYALCRPAPKGKQAKRSISPALVDFAQQLLTAHPKEASHAFVPLVELLEELLVAAERAGRIRSGLHHRHVAGIVLQAIGFNAFAATISGAAIRPGDKAGEELWDVVFHGIGTAPPKR
jgi:AcrR family transcriptional regulator